MLWFNTWTRREPGDGRRARLGIESLETRDTPTNLAPVITDFTASETFPGLYLFYGRVIDESPTGLTVTFGGGTTTLNGQTATVDEDGWFYLAIQLRTDGADAGTVTVQTTDAEALASNIAWVDVDPMYA